MQACLHAATYIFQSQHAVRRRHSVQIVIKVSNFSRFTKPVRSCSRIMFYKMLFDRFAQTTTVCDKKGTRVTDSITAVTRRHYFFKYYLFAENNVKVTVCKAFYLSTLDISQTRVAYFNSNKKQSGLPRESQKGRHRVISDLSKQLKDNIRNHINSIPRIASHYCRARTKKEYVEGNLNLSRLSMPCM